MPANSFVHKTYQTDRFKPDLLRREFNPGIFGSQQYDSKNLRRAHDLENQLKRQREQIARDLHDGIGSQLTHIISRLDMLAYNHHELERPLAILRDFASETVEQLRETIWVLHQTDLTYGQLTERMRGLLTRISCDVDCPKLKVTAYGDSQLALAPQLASSIFRIMQEGVNNAMKYADAAHISVCLATDENSLTLLISDDGKGFDQQQIRPGYGLLNMKKRAEELGGSLRIASSADGTDILAEFPI